MANPKKLNYYLYDNRTKTYFQLRHGMVCGRAEGDMIFTADSLMSRKHCCFHISGNEIYIEDFDSTNRTKVNSVPILPNRRRRIRLNDVIELGTQRWILTNQNRHVPSNVKDLTQGKKFYRALKKQGGGLTTFVTGLNDYTPVLVSPLQYGKLKFTKSLRENRLSFRFLLLVSLQMLGWGALVFIYERSGILRPFLPHPPANFYFKFGILASLSIFFSLIFIVYIKPKLQDKKPARKTLINISFSILMIALLIKVADLTYLIQDTKDNFLYASKSSLRD